MAPLCFQNEFGSQYLVNVRTQADTHTHTTDAVNSDE